MLATVVSQDATAPHCDVITSQSQVKNVTASKNRENKENLKEHNKILPS